MKWINGNNNIGYYSNVRASASSSRRSSTHARDALLFMLPPTIGVSMRVFSASKPNLIRTNNNRNEAEEGRKKLMETPWCQKHTQIDDNVFFFVSVHVGRWKQPCTAHTVARQKYFSHIDAYKTHASMPLRPSEIRKKFSPSILAIRRKSQLYVTVWFLGCTRAPRTHTEYIHSFRMNCHIIASYNAANMYIFRRASISWSCFWHRQIAVRISLSKWILLFRRHCIRSGYLFSASSSRRFFALEL